MREEGVYIMGGKEHSHALYTHTSIIILELSASCVTKYTIMTNRTTHSNFACTLVAPQM